MRAGADRMETPYPLLKQLPAVYQGDAFTRNLTAALDEVLAPVLATLACFPDYLDPRTAPEDFLEWVAGWLALEFDDRWTPERRRLLVAQAVELHRWRGTSRGLQAYVQLLVDGAVEVAETGGCVASMLAGAPISGIGQPGVQVRVTIPDPAAVDSARLRAAVVDLVPAHVSASVDLVAAFPGAAADAEAAPAVGAAGAGTAPAGPNVAPEEGQQPG
ncbi:MAG: phage tail protein [Micromonosporaceae bacterium]|nr:phage tail protein [Micromonosporaceae bacterium]